MHTSAVHTSALNASHLSRKKLLKQKILDTLLLSSFDLYVVIIINSTTWNTICGKQPIKYSIDNTRAVRFSIAIID